MSESLNEIKERLDVLYTELNELEEDARLVQYDIDELEKQLETLEAGNV